MGTIGDLKVLINNQLNRGTIYDAVLGSYIALAGKTIEANKTDDFEYIKKLVSVTGTAGVRTLALPSSRIKSFDTLRYLLASGEYAHPTRVDPSFVSANLSGDPGYFWISGGDTIYFDDTPSRDITFEFIFSEFSDWDNFTDSSTNWLLDIGQNALLQQTLVYLAVADRDTTLLAMAGAELTKALNILTGADEAFAQSLRGNAPIYRGES